MFGILYIKGAPCWCGSFFILPSVRGERKRVPLVMELSPRAALGNIKAFSVTLPNSDARVINRLFLCNKHSPGGPR